MLLTSSFLFTTSFTMARILVGLSGGVDSAVAASRLLDEGHEVIAGFMKNYADEENPQCHTREDRNMALKVAQHLGITTFIIFDFRAQYHEKIIQYIYDGYQAGQTPNPDVLCNSEIKFKLFLEEALKLGCDGVATGHYARITRSDKPNTSPLLRGDVDAGDRGVCDGNIYHLLKGVDATKDQSYFLSGLTQEQLSKAYFPLGHLRKDEVREIAHSIKLPNADRKDSQGLCFIGKVPIKDFLEEALPKKPGNIVDTEGNILGEHEGAHFVTIGQRTGLGLSGGPRYVTKKDTSTNTITVSKDQQKDLMRTSLTADSVHRTSTTPPNFPYECTAKIRYGQEDQACTISLEDKQYLVTFASPQRAIASGQIIVFYKDDAVIGNGVIS